MHISIDLVSSLLFAVLVGGIMKQQRILSECGTGIKRFLKTEAGRLVQVHEAATVEEASMFTCADCGHHCKIRQALGSYVKSKRRRQLVGEPEVPAEGDERGVWSLLEDSGA